MGVCLNIRIPVPRYRSIELDLIMRQDYRDIIKILLVRETERRFGSIENFLRKIGLGKNIDEIKEAKGK